MSSNGLYTTDRNGEIRISGIVGTIVARETKAPEGYAPDPTPQTVTVNPADTQTLTFYNAPQGGVEIIKVSAADRTLRIGGVTFEIRRMDGGLVKTVTTGSTGRVFAALDAGDYYAVEIEAATGYKRDATPRYFTVQNGKTTTLTVENAPFSGILLHKTDSTTGKGIQGAMFLLYDSSMTPVGQYTSDNGGFVYIEGLSASGRCYLRELENPGYVVDSKLKTVYVQPGETTLVEWANTPVTGQIQILKYSSAYNDITGAPAGTPLQGAVYEISEARSGRVVEYIVTDARGVAASSPLPLTRYKIREVTAPAYYRLDETVYDETLEYAGQIIKLAAYDKPVSLGVAITKTGNKEVLAGSQMRYDLTVANTSDTALDGFFWHDRIPTDVTTAVTITTGTYSHPLNYRILYKTSCSSTYQVLAADLSTAINYAFALNVVPLQTGEKVTDIYFDFGRVPSGFQSVTKPTLTVQVSGTVANGYQIVNRADTSGKYLELWVTDQARWVTLVRKLTKTPTLPKTGY